MYKSGFIKLDKKNKESEPEVKKKTKTRSEKGVVFISHIPHGFYEKEMKSYFSQFGKVTNVHIPKSKKNGKAKGFGFIEFLYPEVAKIVAETMNNYLMHKKILKTKYLAPNEVKKNTFWRKNRSTVPLTIQNRIKQRKLLNTPLDPEQEVEEKAKLSKREALFKEKIKSKGLDYEFQLYKPKSLECETKDNDENKTSGLDSATDTKFKSEKDKKIILPKIKKVKGLKKVIKS
ncbi:Hypothetical protein CINCED_3A003074 [Cinara cedri]|uniref:RRM domain-containing protein n=1 Tax=Cinara cedri TaxID=506608 RepID=A0A5E4MQ85_9HEMI|nr:Hypothetical protein CINCED_3A003074 [Cinara cedri]